MIVCFHPTALNDPSAEAAGALTQIFERLNDGAHQWCVPEPTAVLDSVWFRGLGQRDQRRVKILLDKATAVFRAPGLTRRLMVGSGSSAQEWWLGAKRAAFVLMQPLRLILENQAADGAFLRALLLRFGERQLRAKLGDSEWEAVKKEWTAESAGDGRFFRTVHGGGSSIGSVLQQEWGTCASACVAIVDSDHPTPQDQHLPLPKTTWDLVSRALGEVTRGPDGGLPIVIALRRREMENYIPIPALRAAGSARRPALESYEALSLEHRAHFDVKDGLRKALMNGDEQEPSAWQWKNVDEHALWASVDPRALAELRNGFGSDVWRCWQQAHDTINRRSLKDEAGPEFRTIVQAVLEAL